MKKSKQKIILDTDLYHETINRAVQYILCNLHKDLSLSEISKVVYMSPYHFHRIFTKLKGETPSKFVQRNRVAKVSRLIQFKPKMFFHEIAHECGFSTQSLLTKIFFKYYGVTPYKYRKQIKHSIK